MDRAAAHGDPTVALVQADKYSAVSVLTRCGDAALRRGSGREIIVRVRDHLALSSAGAALLLPWLRGRVLWPWAASILMDADHYLWFCVQHRRLNPAAAVRYFNQAQPAQHWGTRLFHSPAVVLPLVLSRSGRAAGLGMAFHVGLDAYHAARTRRARAAALQRDGFTCQGCGTQGAHVVTHLWRQPGLLPSYRAEHLVSLCPACHEAAHARSRQPLPSATRS